MSKYITLGCPVHQRTLSSSTLHPRTGTYTHIQKCHGTCGAECTIATTALLTATAHSPTPTSRISARAARRVGEHKAQDRGLARKWPRERSCHARTPVRSAVCEGIQSTRLLWRTVEERRQAPPKVRFLVVVVERLRLVSSAPVDLCSACGPADKNRSNAIERYT